MKEIWKDVLEFDNLYQISNLGRLFRKSRNVKSSIQKCGFRVVVSQYKKPQTNSSGYFQFSVQINGKRKLHLSHRLVARYFIPNPNKLSQVNHKDGNKLNNCADNLEWVTRQDNMTHAKESGLMAAGERSGNAKLTIDKVLAIKRLYKINPNFNKLQLAKKLGVRDTTIHKIIRNERWKHLS